MKKQELNKTVLSLTVAVLMSSGMLTESSAQNAMLNQNGLITEKTSLTNSSGSFTEIGMSKNDLPAIKGFAKDLPLITVLKQITPNDWVVKRAKGKSLDLQKQVSWSGGQAWSLTLKSIVEANGLNGVVNWDRKEVILSDVDKQEQDKQPMVVTSTLTTTKTTATTTVTAKPTQSVGTFELSNDVVAQGNSGQTEMSKTEMNQSNQSVSQNVSVPLPEPVVVKTWNYDGKNNLKDVVIEWGKVAGYKVVFNGENYPLDKDDNRVLTGDFDGEDGPIQQLSTDYGPNSRVKQPLSFVFYQNKILVVENLRFEQSGYSQYVQK